jgi:hypothetical protein
MNTDSLSIRKSIYSFMAIAFISENKIIATFKVICSTASNTLADYINRDLKIYGSRKKTDIYRKYGKNFEPHEVFILNNFKALNKFIDENDCFSIHNNVLYYDEIKQYVPSEGVLPLGKHLLSKAQASNAQIKEKQSRLNFTCKSLSKYFHIKLVNAFTKADILLFKLQNKYIKELLEDMGQVEIRDESFYRKIIMEEVFVCHMKKLKRLYCEKKLYIVFDKTTVSN